MVVSNPVALKHVNFSELPALADSCKQLAQARFTLHRPLKSGIHPQHIIRHSRTRRFNRN